MTTPSPRQLFSLALAALLILPAVPASAADGGIELHLEQALALQGATFTLDQVAGDDFRLGQSAAGEAEAAEPAVEAPDLTSLGDASRMHEVAAEVRLEQQVYRNWGFGRWLKKYWYIPVLAAGAIVALSDDGSDGPDDVED